MCLSTVYQVVDGKPEPVLTQVSNAEVEGDTVTFTDILGVQTTLEGSITNVDLVDNKIFVTA